ncbi:MAG: hypothetical protein HOP11_07590 [Saprospiraceae bacterium]|nr:hypothetical protein [Saprospiraceae bacterium]
MQILSNIKNRPLVQAGFCLVIAMLLQGILFILSAVFKWNIETADIWLFFPALLLFYVLFNVFYGFEQKSISRYYRDSIYGIVGFLVLETFYTELLTKQKITEVKSIVWIVIVFCIVYLVFISILNLIRFIMYLVLKQDQNMNDEISKN